MLGNSLPFGPGALTVMAFFILSMLGVGWAGFFKRREESLEDFYLAGRKMGFTLLLLTLYATQYSGNTLMGFSGAAYRQGLHFLVSVHFMTAIVAAYLLFAPTLYRLSREHRFLTPGDFIYYRYKNHTLRIIITLLMLFVLCNFIAAQLKTLGTAFAGLSQGRIPMWAGVAGLLIVMLIYESLGGMRSVAWTDAIQGGLLFVGFILLFVLAWTQIGDLPSAIVKLSSDPTQRFKIDPPELSSATRWISFVLMVGLGGAIYPQAIQRIFAASNARVIRRSLIAMAFMPLTTALVAVCVGVIMAGHRPGLAFEGSSVVVVSETTLTALFYEIMTRSEIGYWLVVVLFSALIAAVMSTTDSALLSIGSMVAQDLYLQYIHPTATQSYLTSIGRWSAWLLMIPVTWIALVYEGNLIQLLQLKFELLIQCVPAIYLGIHWNKLSAETVLMGIAAGVFVIFGLTFFPEEGFDFWNVHPGVIGLVVNFLVCGRDRFRKGENI
tara:strand:+ start:4283 stop:5767 length:1485 start_codon:yes stop_codon:yes gene_type:complete